MLVVEGICASGLTLSYLLRNFQTRNPASIKVCAFVAKQREGPASWCLTTWAARSRTSSWSATASTGRSSTATSPTSPGSRRRSRSPAGTAIGDAEGVQPRDDAHQRADVGKRAEYPTGPGGRLLHVRSSGGEPGLTSACSYGITGWSGDGCSDHSKASGSACGPGDNGKRGSPSTATPRRERHGGRRRHRPGRRAWRAPRPRPKGMADVGWPHAAPTRAGNEQVVNRLTVAPDSDRQTLVAPVVPGIPTVPRPRPLLPAEVRPLSWMLPGTW